MDLLRGLFSNNIDGRAYGMHVFYRVEFKDNKGNEYIADILTRSTPWYAYGRVGKSLKPNPMNPNTEIVNFYTAGEIVEGAFSPLVISRTREDQTDPMYTGIATLTVWSDTDSKFLHLTQETDAVMLYVWVRGNYIYHNLIFSGVLDTSQYTEPYNKRDRYFVELTFQEYGQLKRTKHKLIQGQTVQEHIRTLLNQRFECCGYREDLPNEDVPIDFGVQGIRPDISLFEDDNGKRDDAWSVLNMLLKNFGFTLLQSNNVLERVGLTQIYIKKGEQFKNEPRLKEVSNDNTLTITEQAKEVEVTVKIAGTEQQSKAMKFPDFKTTTPPTIYRYDVPPYEKGVESVYYPAYKVDFSYMGYDFYMGKVQKFTEGEQGEEFLTLFYNCVDVTSLREMFGGNYERYVSKTLNSGKKYRTSYALAKHRLINIPIPRTGEQAEKWQKDKRRVVFGVVEENDKFTTVSDGFILTDPIVLPKIKKSTTNEDETPDYYLNIGLKLKVGLYSNLYHELTRLELEEEGKYKGVTVEGVQSQMKKIWNNRGAYLYGALLALDDENKVVAYLKSEGGKMVSRIPHPNANVGVWRHELQNTIKYSWVYVDDQTPLKTKQPDFSGEGLRPIAPPEESDELTAGKVIDNKYIKDYACGFAFGSSGGLGFGRWENMSNPPYAPNNHLDDRNEERTIFADEGLNVLGLPEEKNGRTPTRLLFVCFRKIVIALRELNTWHFTPAVANSDFAGYKTVEKEGDKHIRQFLGVNMSYKDCSFIGEGVHSERDNSTYFYPFTTETKPIVGGSIGTEIFPYYPTGFDKREILSPYYILVKDPEISIRDFQTVLNQGEEYKESKTTIKSIYSKGNTDTIKEELFYDDKKDIPLTSPSRVFAPHADAITPEAQGADFRFFSFSDLRAFDILTKKGVGLINMEGTFRYDPRRHWGVFYHRGNKYIASREEIDLKAGKSVMTLHQLAQADPNTITKKIDEKDE